jgi:hypothetical protein
MSAVKVDNNNINKVVFSRTGGVLNVRETPSTYRPPLLVLQPGQPAGRTTGNYLTMQDGNWYQVSLIKPVGNNKYGYVRQDVVRFENPAQSPIAESNAQKLLNDLVETDKENFARFYVIAAQLAAAQKKGINITAQKQSLTALVNRFIQRQRKLQNSNLVKASVATTDFINKLKGFVGIGEVVIGTGVVIGVSVAAGAALAAAAYYAFKPDYDQAYADKRAAIALEDFASKLSPQDYAALKEKVAKEISEAYNQGKSDGSKGGAFTVVKYLVVAFLGFIAVDKFLVSRKNG